ncbi:MAG: adenylate/guanylate cyclase domain-containing protein [Bacteroidota bacterium]
MTSTRRLAAIMFTDIVGYTAMMQEDEAKAAKVRQRHREVFLATHEQHNGKIIQYFGDGTLSVFDSAVEAVNCAIAIQQSLNQDEIIPLRIGLHIGDILFDGTDIYGDGVNLASRIEGLGVAGAILLSGTVNQELVNQSRIQTQSLGTVELKNIEGPKEIFAVTNQGITVPSRADLTGKRVTPTKSIAVLPFVNMSSSQENEYFSDGMTEEIINALTGIESLKVTSRTSSFHFKGKNLPIHQIGRELNVSAILEGSIRLAGNNMRITAQLIDVEQDIHFWSETFDRKVEDVFAVQDEISLLIAERFREQFGHLEIQEHLVEAPEVPVPIYQQYLKARYHLLKMGKSDIETGIDLLENILKQSPDYALAHLGINLGYTLMGTIGFMPSAQAFVAAHPYLTRAIELAPELPECQLHMAWISMLQDWNPAGVYQHLEKVFEIRPIVDYYQTMTSILTAEGKTTAAHHYIDQAIQMDPFSEVNFHLKGFTFYLEEKFDQAIAYYEKVVSMNGNKSLSLLEWGNALILSDRPEEALALFQRLPEDQPGDILKLSGTTIAQLALGNPAESQVAKLYQLLDTELAERAMNVLISCEAVRGRTKEMYQLIEKGISIHLPLMIYLPNEPLLKPFRKEARFQELMGQILKKDENDAFPHRKYKQSLFSEPELAAHIKQVADFMERDRPYLDASLTLRKLADQLNLPANHLSQILNEGFDQNFAAFVNTYRLEAFKERVREPSSRQLTVLALAYDSGFNSKTVFNTFFKKKMGKTPRAYWKEVTSQ